MKPKRGVVRCVMTACTLMMVLALTPAISAQQQQKREITLNINGVAEVYAAGFRLFEKELHDLYGVTMKFDMAPPQDVFSKLIIELASGYSSYDIILLEGKDLSDLSPYLTPMDVLSKSYNLDFAIDDIGPRFLQGMCMHNNILYGIPWDGDMRLFFYNTTAFERPENKLGFKKKYGYELAPPETWDQYRDMAEYFSTIDWSGDGRKKYGTVEAWQRGQFAWTWWYDRFVGYGGLLFDSNMKPLINSQNGIKALENMIAVKPFCPPGTMSFGYPESYTAFIKGDAPMIMQWTDVGKSSMDPQLSDIAGKVGITIAPGARNRRQTY